MEMDLKAYNENMRVCHRCERSRGCNGACPCQADPRKRMYWDIAAAGDCPLGKFGATVLPSGSTADEIVTACTAGRVLADSEWCYWPAAREAHRQMMRQAAAAIPAYPDTFRGSGVVIVGGGRYFASAFVTVRVLRHHGYTGPIQLWYSGGGEILPWQRKSLDPYGVELIDAKLPEPEVEEQRPHYELKTLAVLRSPFEKVLYLDADSYPTRNPDFLFGSDEFARTGAIFWPDQDHFEIRADTFDALGIARSSRPIESGQFVVDKRRCWRELNLAHWMDQHSHYYYGLMNGDTGTLRFGWLYFGSPVAMPQKVLVVEQPAMLQHDFNGDVLFVHRSESKFTLSARHACNTGRFSLKWRTPPVRNDRLPAESLAWGFFDELRAIYDESLKELVKPEPVPVAAIVPKPDIPLAGDIVEAIAHKIGADKLAAWWTKRTGIPCGCQERKQLLNDATIRLRNWWTGGAVGEP